jgi:putative ABC transport system permease protein
VVLSHALWQQRFGADPAIVGRTLTLSGTPHTVVGVMPRTFRFPSAAFQLWVPMASAMATAPQQMQNRLLRIFRCLARLAPDVTPEAARAEVEAFSARLGQRYPDTNRGFTIQFRPLREYVVGDVRPALIVTFGAVALVLLVTCANLANLQVARAVARQRELSIRLALGATRARVVRALFVESAIVALAGGGSALPLASWGIRSVRPLLESQLPRAAEITLDTRLLLFAAATTALTAVLSGLAPILQLGRQPAVVLTEGRRGTTGGSGGLRLRSALVMVEVALAVTVLVGAALLGRSFVRLVGADAGFDPHGLLTFNLELFRKGDEHARAQAAGRVLERLRALPGVQAVGGGTGLPPVTAQRVTRFTVDGRGPEDGPLTAYFIAASPDYFRALGTPLAQGRWFDDRDRVRSAPVVLISRALARRLFGGSPAVGRRLRLVNPEYANTWREVVGVVGDVRYQGLADAGPGAIYTPFEQTPFLWMYVAVRAADDPMALARSIANAVRDADPDLRAANLAPMTALVGDAVASPRFNMLFVSAFAAIALGLAVIGVYAVMAYAVVQRTREIGVRVALGAAPAGILRLVVGHGAGLALKGIAIGLVLAAGATRVMRNLLYDVSPTDPLTFAGVAALLAAIALLAAYLPARRATRIDPIVALRSE